jgi:hypothetical protein
MKKLEEQRVCVCVFAANLVKIMGMMLKARCNRRSGWGTGLLDQKRTDESVKDQGVVGCVF